MDYPHLASQFLRALRGRRSQLAFSRRLGYASNVAYAWEAGRRFPTAAETMRAAALSGVDIDAAWERFYSTPPAWLRRIDPTSARGIAWILGDLRGRTPVADVARRSGLSRFALSRWLNGQTEPRLPQFFLLFDSLSLRLLDLLAAMVRIEDLPCASQAWKQVEAQRRAAFELPWTQAVLRVLEIEAYQRLAAHDDGWVAQRLSITEAEVLRCLQALSGAGQIAMSDRLWRPTAVVAVDTRGTPEDGRRMKSFWAQQGLQHLRDGASGLYSYNVFGISAADLQRLRKLHLAYFRQVRAIVAESTPTQRVAAINLQLFELDQPTEPDSGPARPALGRDRVHPL